MRDTMTTRERWLAALRCEPVDRLPFWPKINATYARRQQPPFDIMSAAEIHAYIGSDVHAWGPSPIRATRRTTSVEVHTEGDTRRTVYRTPRGDLTYVEQVDPWGAGMHPREFPVKTADDIETMALVWEDERPEFDPAAYERAVAFVSNLGDRGSAATEIGISPLMNWLQHIAGIENGHYLLADEPERVETLFARMHAVLRRRAEIVADRGPYDVIYSVENTSTTLISPEMFRRYSARHLMEYGRIIAGAGRLHVLHMCGHLRALLPDISPLPAAAVEAFTSPTVGNTTLADGRAGMPGKCLIGGTNAALWLDPADTIVATLARDLSALPHRRGIVVTSAGVMPPACRPETIRRVGEWVRAQAA